jgi:hypothetical protein
MSKSAFYASKESLRKQRELEFARVKELEAFLDEVLHIRSSDEFILVDTMDVKQRAWELKKTHA